MSIIAKGGSFADAGTRSGDNVTGIQLPEDVHGIDAKKLAAMGITFAVVRSA